MELWKTAALSAALLGAAGAGAALAPVAQAQDDRARIITPRPLEVFTTGGGRLGISVSDTEATDAKTPGVVIDAVEEDSPAEKAGFKKGDVVVEFDGERVRSVRQFTRLVTETPAGRQVAAALMRDGQRVNVNVTTRSRSSAEFEDFRDFPRTMPPLPARPARPMPVPRPPRAAPRPPVLESFLWPGNQLGVTVNEMSDQLGEYFGARNGVLVTSVTEGSAAAKAGVKAGDVIVSVNGETVENAGELRRELRDAGSGAEFTLNVMRDRKPVTLKGKLEANTDRHWTTRTSCSERCSGGSDRGGVAVLGPCRRGSDQRRELRRDDRGGGESRRLFLTVMPHFRGHHTAAAGCSQQRHRNRAVAALTGADGLHEPRAERRSGGVRVVNLQSSHPRQHARRVAVSSARP